MELLIAQIVLLVVSVLVLGLHLILYVSVKLEHPEVPVIPRVPFMEKSEPNAIDQDETLPIEQFTPDFTKPINVVVKD